MSNTKFKLGYGNKQNIQSAISEGLLDGGDLIITKDTREFAFIKPDSENTLLVKSRVEVFDSLTDAEEYVASDTSAYAGEPIIIKINDIYKTYMIQESISGLELGTYTESKEYVKMVDELPSSDREKGSIYIVDSTGYIWSGNEWRIIFEDVATSELKEYTDSKAEQAEQNAVEESKTYINDVLTIVDF